MRFDQFRKQSMTDKASLTIPQYEQLDAKLQQMSDIIRVRPEMNHHFADRLAILSKEMREDEACVYPLTAKN